MANLKDIQNAIIEKQKGLNADIENLLRITKENTTQKENALKQLQEKENKYKDALIKLGVKCL